MIDAFYWVMIIFTVGSIGTVFSMFGVWAWVDRRCRESNDFKHKFERLQAVCTKIHPSRKTMEWIAALAVVALFIYGATQGWGGYDE